MKRPDMAWRLAVAGLCSGLALGISRCPAKPAGDGGDSGQAGGRPALVVVIAVDQLRADLLTRYATAFTGGFKRLRDQGHWFTHTLVDHAITVSHPGHATLATGMHPSHHGIVDAAFYAGPPGARVFTDAVEDKGAPIVGETKLPGASPRQFLATTLAEWIAAASTEARVVAVGSGRFSSLLHAGRAKGDVYWYDGEAGRYVTSSYYRSEDAPWVTRFNAGTLRPLVDAAVTWTETTPEPLRALAGRDDARWEADHEHVTFPHDLAKLASREKLADPRVKAGWFATVPMLDGATLALAAAGVDALQLGRRGVTDYLGIVSSQVDDIGHWYGPSSREQLDNLIRLDRALGDLFDHLDASVGKGRWVVALSADHGIPDVPEERVARGEKARRVGMKDYSGVLQRVKTEREHGAKDPAALAEAVARIVEVPDFVADAMTPKDLFEGTAADPYVELYRHSARPDRLPRFPLFDFDTGRSIVAESGVAVRLVPEAMPDIDTAVHGSPYLYDRSVPLVFMGPGIRPGASSEDARTIDLAPTLARLAGIPVPPGLDGKVLLH
ncbi:MAG TPA: alkaline phosphatase family protein [Candidatus Polarisedimenticolia bacterium]|nr:alkaline phosphatase family protein [Candidatus Polarisedimenticolia bacterium]